MSQQKYAAKINVVRLLKGFAKLKFLKSLNASAQDAPEEDDYYIPQKRRRFQFIDKGMPLLGVHAIAK